MSDRLDATLYYLDTAIYPTAVVVVTALTCRSALWLVGAMFGFVLFTFVEYIVHRWILHKFFYHGTHERHHTHPEELGIIWYVPLLFVAFFFAMPHSVFAGFTLAYCWFILMHHLMHHVDLGRHRWIANYSRWHALHHRMAYANYGITQPFWDVVFGTYRRPRQRGVG